MDEGVLTPNIEISSSAVLVELEKVLADQHFASAPRLSRFLRYVVTQTLEGSAATLKEYRLGQDVFDRGQDFDPRSDALVRVEARQVRFKLAQYYAGPGANDEIVIGVPKGGYAASFTPRESGIFPDQADLSLSRTVTETARPQTKTRVSQALFGVAAVMLLVSGAAVWQKNRSIAPVPVSTSIAVLPFTNLSQDPGNQYFSDGLTDEIAGELSRFKNLRVSARTSAFQFRGKSANLREIGRQLGVATILEGSVERYGDRVKVVAQLERVSDGSHLWTNTYERQTFNLFTIQSELALAIASSLNTSPAVPSRHVVRDPEALDAHMRARYELEVGSPEKVLAAQANFQKAIDRDPDYAAAYAGLGSARYNLGAARFNSKFTDRKGSEEMWSKALVLDPNQEEAHCGMALLAMQYDWNWSKAEQEVRAALASGPSARAELRYASILIFQRRFQESGDHLLRSQEIDPIGARYMLARGQMWMLQKRWAEARMEVQEVLDRYPGMVQAQTSMSFLDFEAGHPDLALTRMHKLARTEPSVRVLEASLLSAQGRHNEALRIIDPYQENYLSGDVPMASFALVYAGAGDVANTIKWLERSADRHEWQALSVAVNPAYEKMQKESAFLRLKSRMHLPD